MYIPAGNLNATGISISQLVNLTVQQHLILKPHPPGLILAISLLLVTNHILATVPLAIGRPKDVTYSLV